MRRQFQKKTDFSGAGSTQYPLPFDCWSIHRVAQSCKLDTKCANKAQYFCKVTRMNNMHKNAKMCKNVHNEHDDAQKVAKNVSQ